MTSWSDILLTTAQVAVAFAGFTGLIGLFITRERGGIEREAMLRFRMMLDYSLITLLAAFFPFLPAALDASDAAIWRVSSIALLVGLGGYWWLFGRILLRAARGLVVSKAAAAISIAGDIASLLLLISNAAGLLHTPFFFPYLAVVFWQLVGAVIGFAGVVALAWTGGDE